MEIDAQLIHDCFHLGQLENSSVLLNRNAAVGWLILVPATNAVDWHQLDAAEHKRVTGQMRLLSGWAADWFHADKMNVASLGNSVRQMHIHIVARHLSDPCWPLPVWGFLETRHRYTNDAVRQITDALVRDLDLMALAADTHSEHLS